ncbi:hypothetical protein SAMN04488009_1955 [Maribacter sedimenticola]|uniref:Uncharacterized protein n=2 Tax=Maribacter sedimenticola TaxID=228956 RepID=A0ABY1SH67_9FLAO|nr:hypothetical protein SAMN04488009_1955 [Maribacter sedimenticola]
MTNSLATVRTLYFLFCAILVNCNVMAQQQNFNMSKDLLLVQMDCKTDIDDLHTAAGLATLVNHVKYAELNYLPIVGTYGIQEGLYVPPNELMQLAFGKNWLDAHKNWKKSVKKVVNEVHKIIAKGGDVWVAEAGQSDFTADWVQLLMEKNPDIEISNRIHVVQHSDWNESATDPDKLAYVQKTTDYHKIADGNAEGNGTPGLKSEGEIDWQSYINDTHLIDIWNTSIRLGNQYNGKDGRYLNESVADGGLDFSDLSEVCYILGEMKIVNTVDFFEDFKVK